LVVPTLIVWGISVAGMFAPGLVAVMNSVPDEKQGQASGIVLTSQILGATIGLAVLSALLSELHSFRIVFITTALFVFFALVVGWFFLDRKQELKSD